MPSSRNTTEFPSADALMAALGRKLKKAAAATAERKLATGEYVNYQGSYIPAEYVPNTEAADVAVYDKSDSPTEKQVKDMRSRTLVERRRIFARKLISQSKKRENFAAQLKKIKSVNVLSVESAELLTASNSIGEPSSLASEKVLRIAASLKRKRKVSKP